MIEYMLMLVIIVMLVLGLTLAFFKPLQNFITKLNSTYIKCLLETGELPTLKAEGTTTCSAEMPQFEVGEIDPANAPTRGNQSSSNSSNSENQSSSSSKESSSGSDIASASAGRPPNRQSSLIRDGMRQTRTAQPETNASKTTTIAVDEFQGGEGFMNFRSDARMSVARKKTQKVGVDGLMEYDRRKIAREEEKTRTLAMDSESFTRKGNKKIIVKPPEEKKVDDDLNVKTDFGFYFKVFFMIVILLFIILLVVNQAMQLNNSSND